MGRCRPKFPLFLQTDVPQFKSCSFVEPGEAYVARTSWAALQYATMLSYSACRTLAMPSGRVNMASVSPGAAVVPILVSYNHVTVALDKTGIIR